jgi:hypothetical protein
VGETVVIERRFRGPPDSANGGYACGTVAAHVEGAPAVEATLRSPPPLDTPLSLEPVDGGVELRDGSTLVAEARSASAPELDLPAPVTLEDAWAARQSSPLHQGHPYPMCFVCGPERGPGDGLRVICGPVPGREEDVIAAPWETDDSMASEEGLIGEELIWSVLDCPSGLAGVLLPGLGVTMLGRLRGELRRPIPAGQNYVAIGWPIERDGRKFFSGTAILDQEGEPLAVARATWIELRDQR